jgi:hypothetical protein
MSILSQTSSAMARSSAAPQYFSSSSSSQFFMNKPITSQPCSFNRQAATEEADALLPVAVGRDDPQPGAPQKQAAIGGVLVEVLDDQDVFAIMSCYLGGKDEIPGVEWLE